MKKLLFLLFTFYAFCLTAQCDRQSDSLELKLIYETLNGVNWEEAWDFQKPLDEFPNLVLNSEGCVERLLLVSDSIDGLLFDFKFSAIKRLEIKSAGIKGEIPDFKNLDSLEYLRLNCPFLEGEIPNFSNLRHLEHLDITAATYYNGLIQNPLGGVIPDFTNLAKLEFLQINRAAISGPIPDFNYLPMLKTINITNCNRILDTIPNFSKLPLLESIGFQYCDSISGALPNLNHMPNLTTSLFVGLNNVVGNIPKLDSCLSLKYYWYYDLPKISGAIPNLSHFDSLYYVLLANSNYDSISFIKAPVVNVENNNLTFDDLLNVSTIEEGNNFRYTRQDSVFALIDIIKSDDILTCNIHNDLVIGDALFYIFKDDILIDSTDNYSFDIAINEIDSSMYRMEWTSISFEKERLVSYPFYLDDFIMSTSVELASKDNVLTVFPNPTSGIVNIEFVGANFKYVNIYSSLGEFIKESCCSSSKTIDLRNLSKGIYFLVFYLDDGKRLIRKLILK